jgi:hypothetical protein
MDYAENEIAANEITDIDPGVFPFGTLKNGQRQGARKAVITVVEDGFGMSSELWAICEFLDVAVVRVPGTGDLAKALERHAPMAVICALDGVGQDGCHVMKTVACHDTTLPILIVIGEDTAIAGAADAVQELWKLTDVTKTETLPGIAGLVDFLFQVGRKGGCMRLMPAHG